MGKFHKIKSTHVKVGDWAIHRNGKLDARRVAKVEGVNIWLEFTTGGGMFGPYPRRNYVFQRRAK